LKKNQKKTNCSTPNNPPKGTVIPKTDVPNPDIARNSREPISVQDELKEKNDDSTPFLFVKTAYDTVPTSTGLTYSEEEKKTQKKRNKGKQTYKGRRCEPVTIQ